MRIQSESSRSRRHPLNESPSEKEGKCVPVPCWVVPLRSLPSMKVPPKRKGNEGRIVGAGVAMYPQ